MLKWLSGARHQTANKIVTDDPLATICVHKVDRPLEIYAVSRSVPCPGLNPIFDEEEDGRVLKSDPKRQFLYHPQQQPQVHKSHGSPEFSGKSGSSGYGSSNRCHSSSEYSSSGADEAPPDDDVPPRACGPQAGTLREDAVTVLEQNVGFVKSILVAVRGGPKRHSGAAATLSPIPEGKVDHSIPRPVWPPREAAPPPDSLVDDALLLYTSFTLAPSPVKCPADVDNNIPTATETQDLLRELSDTLSQAMEGSTPEEVLRGLSRSINRKLEALQCPEDALRKLSVTLSHREPLARVSRALSSNGSSGGSLRTDKDRLLSRGSSSTSSSSGFSDLTQASSRSEAMTQPPVFLHEDLGSVPNSVRNAVIYGTLCRLGTGKTDVPGAKGVEDEGGALWDTYCGAGVTAGDVRLKTAESYYYPSPDRPDFTLDMHRAERLMRKIKSAKRRRCWCRVVTSLAGLVFFLMSVMVVSMMLTRGKRVFGPI